MVRRLCLVAISVGVAFSAVAEDSVKSLCENVVKYESEGQIRKAMEEVGWIQNSLNQANQKKIAELLPKNIGEFVGGEVKTVDLMGMASTEREYTAGGSTIKFSLMGSSAGATKNAGNPFAAFGQLAIMGAGLEEGARTVRLQGRSVTFKEEPGAERVEVTIALKSGSMVRLEADGIKDPKKLEESVGKMDLTLLESYLS